MNERIKMLRKKLGMTMERFSEVLGISKSGISEIESGRRNVTDQHIKLIVSSPLNGQHVSEQWLRTGEGEMFVQMDIEDEIASLIAKLPNEPKGSFKRRLLATLAVLTEDQWVMLADMAEKLAEKEEADE
ncbi:MAG: helix-turn-helix transcriptional regulator [Blautia sp.]|nr:helix-turn-helix transcriptional regulator [Blautia sp.]